MALLTKNFDQLKATVEAHVAADALIKGDYWDAGAENAVGGMGCFIGCLAHGDDPKANEELYGLPIMLQRVCESIYEDLPSEDREAFFAALPDAVERDGKDLTKVAWAFLASELRALPKVSDDVQAAIDPVIEGMDLLAAGKEWPGAADAARAARAALTYTYTLTAAAAARDSAAAAAAAADAADAAARDSAAAAAAAADAADAAVWAADAAADAAAAADARLRQRDTILRLIKEAV